MIPRYADPDIAELWSPIWTYQTWLHIETLTLAAQRTHDVLPDDAQPLLTQLLSREIAVDQQAVEKIAELEAQTGHDVVAFLDWVRGSSGPAGRFLHYGLTSSDLVDTTMGIRFRHAGAVLRNLLQSLTQALTEWTRVDYPVLGRTHGQVAEPMEIRARALHWMTLLAWPGKDVSANSRRLEICKLSGPVGTFAHNPPEVEATVAIDLGLRPMGSGASQIVPRSALAAWASSAAGVVEALAKIATDIRLMNLLGEMRVPMTDGQVGSSSMAHKQNPIAAEQICGLAQMARGYASMLQPVAGWLERDIAHSCVERVAVPDLWHVLLHAMKQTIWLLRKSDLDHSGIINSFEDAGVSPLVSELTLEAIRDGEPVGVARAWARTRNLTADTTSAVRFMRNYPEGV